MKHIFNKKISILYAIYFFSIHIILCHGFASNTLVQISDGSQKTIRTLCHHILHNKTYVLSHNTKNSCNVVQRIIIGKTSKSNCYIQLCFDEQFNDIDILCTPTQEFYVALIQQWVPAYLLKVGDGLLTSNMTERLITYKEFVQRPIFIYMIEVQKEHTFFVGKYGVLTHNIFLPVAINLALAVPFGSVATGTIGSFFGPIGLIGGIALGGIVSIVIKAMYKNHIPHYKTPIFNISFIENNCQNLMSYSEDITATSSGCFTLQESIDSSCSYPIENPLPQLPTGCIEIEVLNNHTFSECNKVEQEKVNKAGCFEQSEQQKKVLYNKQDQIIEAEKIKIRYQGETARNWDEFEKNCHMGKKYGKYFIHTGKRNPKDGAPIQQLTVNIPNTEMFKKGYQFALDKFHKGDHFEVWKNNKWIGVANLDGSKNETKTNAESNTKKRDLDR